MDIGEIISESLKYPLSDINAFLKVDLLFLLIAFPLIISSIGAIAGSQDVIGIGGILLLICAVIFGLIIAGYLLSVTREGIDTTGIIPGFDIGKNVIDSIKTWILSFVFSIIPFVIIFLLSFFVLGAGAISGSTTAIGVGAILLIIITIILEIVFGLLLVTSIMRLAKYDSLSEALSLSSVFEDLKEIGIIRMIVLFIILGIILGIISLIGVLFQFIPILGDIVLALIIMPYSYLVSSYAMGLMYSDVA